MLATDNQIEDLSSWLQILERIVEQSANMVVITDATQRIQWVNQTYSRVTGWSLDEARGRKAGELVHGPATDRATCRQVGATLRQGHAISGVELINYRKCGEPYTVLLNVEPIRDNAGQTIAYFSIQSDISERRALEQSNVLLQQHLLAAQQLACLGRIDLDTSTQTVHCSNEMHAILETSPEERHLGVRELVGFVDPIARPLFREHLSRTLSAGEDFDLELPIITGKGRRRWVRCRGVPERSAGCMRPPSTWTVQDVTVYRELIEQKRLSNESLQTMVQDRTRNLEEANRALEAFSHALSHDLKKPIRHMVSFSEIVSDSLSSGDVGAARHYSSKIVAAGAKLQSVIDGILTFSRLGRQGLRLERVDMAHLVRECLNDARQSFPEQRLTISGIESLPQVSADPVLMREVWSNLLDNALKYSGMREETCLHWTCLESEREWTISLRDNGCGFNATHHEHIFEMFARSDPAGPIPGDGIGLALCQRIVESHGGRIRAESLPEQGACFHVTLPKDPPVANNAAGAQTASAWTAPQTASASTVSRTS